MVLEDQALIGMSLEAYLEEAGYRTVGPFPTSVQALAWLESNTPDLALLDVLLRDGPCTRVVRELRSRRVPFAIYSGLQPGTRTPDLDGVPWLEKPLARDELVRVLGQLAGAGSAGDLQVNGATQPSNPASQADATARRSL
jgi:DNA-binding response OmpR family regulator